ncbi:MAG: ribosomal protein methylthiotransferase [Peptococcaceae bacterium]|jgi:ribosomal protein S12 methylthiotransferase|nr:ribosomal protein methylthiotransferase [Peptococcaceae bacterium]
MSYLVKIVTLGCPKNTVDSEQILGQLFRHGHQPVDDPSKAEVIVINTCGFIESAKRESIETILELAQQKIEGKCQYLIVTGCLVQKYADELKAELPEVDLFLGTGDIHLLPQLLASLKPGVRIAQVGDPDNYLFDDEIPLVPGHIKHYAYVKIAEGCNNCCTYCVIPSMRGKYRSRSLESIVHEVSKLTENGVKEAILVAQDITLYGYDKYGRYMLPALLQELVKLKNLQWIRLLYCYPNRLTDELLLTIKKEHKICRYLDIPLQHISDSVLKAMGRPMGKQDTIDLLKKIRKLLPGVTLRSTFIIGFPGESEEDFAQLLAFLEDMQFERAGFFTYSPEPGTKAAGLPLQIPEEVKELRLQQALAVQEKILAAKQAQQVGMIIPVIVDGPSPEYEGLWEGRTQGDAPEIDGVVYIKPAPNLRQGDIINIKITHSQDFALMGEVNDEPGQ